MLQKKICLIMSAVLTIGFLSKPIPVNAISAEAWEKALYKAVEDASKTEGSQVFVDYVGAKDFSQIRGASNCN